jgi:hypothetical protein
MVPGKNDAKHTPPYYDNPCGMACWPICEASTMFSKPGGHPDYSHPQNGMIWNIAGPGCYLLAPLAYFYYCFFWGVSCFWCCSDLPCTEKPVTALFAANYPDRLIARPVQPPEEAAASGQSVHQHQPRKDPLADPSLDASPPPYTPPPAAFAEPAEDEQHRQLRKFKQMLDDGLITEADYEAKKKEVLFG